MSITDTQQDTCGDGLLDYCMLLVITSLFTVVLCEGYVFNPALCSCWGNAWNFLDLSGSTYDEVPAGLGRQLTRGELAIKGFVVLLGVVLPYAFYWVWREDWATKDIKKSWGDWPWVIVAIIVCALILAMPHIPRQPRVTCTEYHRGWMTSDQTPSHLNGEVS